MLTKKILCLIFILIIFISGFTIGSFLNETQRFQFYNLIKFINLLKFNSKIENAVIKNDLGRIISFQNKKEVGCPDQTKNTIVLLAIGQSNATNSQGQKHISKYGAQVLNYWDGKCYIASSPLLGANNIAGEMWTLLGNELVKSNITDQFIVLPLGIGGSSSLRWSANNDISKDVINNVKNSQYKVTHIIFHQGEADYDLQVSSNSYYENIYSFIKKLRENNITAPFWISVASRCGYKKFSLENDISNAQKRLSKDIFNVFIGPNTDELLFDFDRFDGCHFSGSGQLKFVNEAIKIIFSSK